MYGLERPAWPSCLDLERDDGAAILLIEGPTSSAVEVRTRIARGDVDQAQVLVGGEHGPGIWRAAGVGLTNRREADAVRGAHVPRPLKSTGNRVKGSYGPGGHVNRLIVQHEPAHDDVILDDRRRGGLRLIVRQHLAHAL